MNTEIKIGAWMMFTKKGHSAARARSCKVLHIYGKDFEGAVRVIDSTGEIVVRDSELTTEAQHKTALAAHNAAQKLKKKKQQQAEVISRLRSLVKLYQQGITVPAALGKKLNITPLTAGLRIKAAKKYGLIK